MSKMPKMKLELDEYPHWQYPYNQYFYMVVNEKGEKKTFCHIDTAVYYYEEFGVKIYIKTKDLYPTVVLWKHKEA